MQEITYKMLSDLQEVHLSNSKISVNRVMLQNSKKIILEPIDSLLVQLHIVNDQDQVVASLSVGSNERLLINEKWSYIEKV